MLFYEKNGHGKASCWKKQATSHKPDHIQRKYVESSPNQQQTQRHMRGVYQADHVVGGTFSTIVS